MEKIKDIRINVPKIEPRLKHQTIFQTFNDLNNGESMIILNDHDPKPVYYQLLGIYGEIFTWNYLQNGPSLWEIKVTKSLEKNSEEDGHLILNIPQIEPRLRHFTIFQEFDKLQSGKSLIIQNNHDPKPVFHQMQELRGDVFNWKYLKSGPEIWEVLLTKKQETQPQGISFTHQGEIMVSVPEITPQLKHETIFKTFEELKPGGSMIIHNDHDPKPVYYQLKSMHGDTFSWSYLQEGPEWWDIRVAKNEEKEKTWEEQVGHALSRNEENDIVINIPELQPKLKHPTIFKTFENLKEGESLVIHNDHDPKPVYYQLLGEYGNVFSWKYLQEGPVWWDIRVTKSKFNPNESVGEISAKDFRKAEVFKKFGIDFSCNGKKTLTEVCEEKGLDVSDVEKELNQPSENELSNKLNYQDWEIGFLADYIVNIHHSYAKKFLPEINQYAKKVAEVHGDKHPELIPLKEKVEKFYTSFSNHLAKEENIIFPKIKEISKNKAISNSISQNFEELVIELENQHQEFQSSFLEIRKLTDNFKIPNDACTSYKLLFNMLQEFEKDLQLHLHLENNILFPKASEIEKTLV